MRAIVEKYEGSHNFHNFTVGRHFNDRSTSRFMKKIEVCYLVWHEGKSNNRQKIAEPVVYGETEWISVLFHGQSFMLHQVPYNALHR